MRVLCSVLIVIFLTSCRAAPATPVPTEPPAATVAPTTTPTNSWLPQPGDAWLTRGEVYPDAADILISGSNPVVVNLVVKGSLPNPCHQVRVLFDPPDGDNQVRLQLYSVVDPTLICIQVLQDFELSIPLGSYPPGAYSVWINNVQIGEFEG